MKKYVFMFKEADGKNKSLFGGKGANLAEMTKIGLPVPQGFIITTEVCTKFYEQGQVLNESVVSQIENCVAKLEKITGKRFGQPENPLLLSVRSGARVSMPGMMDSILNLGLNDEVVEGLAKLTNNPCFAYDAYRRFIQMFGEVVMQQDKLHYERALEEVKAKNGAKFDSDLSEENLKQVVDLFKKIYKEQQKEPFPEDPKTQLIEAVCAVFKSWNNERANVYRRMHNIPYNWGTAVNVQAMVFGNMGQDCGTGVAFSRNPATGENKIYGEYMINAQGEDLVAGIRTPQKISELENQNPQIYAQFVAIAKKLEKHYKDMQDMEFTVENGKLFILQTRNGKRTANAALKIATDLVKEGQISEKQALLMLDPNQLDSLLHPIFDQTSLAKANCVGQGLPSSPGAACGKICFSAEKAKEQGKKEKVVLVRNETSSEDIEGMFAAQGVLTVRGGMTAHAAVVARGMGSACVVGCSDIKFAADGKSFSLGGKKFKEGDVISFDGSTGKIYDGQVPLAKATVSGDFAVVMQWADKYRTMEVRSNVDNPRDAAVALEFGAEGIGLCRTEHMFFDADRLQIVRYMIAAQNEEQRKLALKKLLPMQQKDFEGLFRVMKDKPVTIRLLDPPLHEFLPTTEQDVRALAKEMGVKTDEVLVLIESLQEVNPMMGHRGLRLAVTYPEIAEMQTEAIIKAAINVSKSENVEIAPEIMIPLTSDSVEFKYVKDIVTKTADRVIEQSGVRMVYEVGTMIETPRAAITADQIAKYAEFFSFGTNDLTQLAYGFSRDDAEKFLNVYLEKRICDDDPFISLDQNGVGKFVRIATELGLSTRPNIKLGICGEHGGEPSSIEFCHRVGLDYVSCSAYRVPIARLAAAQAAIKFPRKKRRR